MYPFETYPHQGLTLLGKSLSSNARHGYGLELQKRTGQTACAYCQVSLIDDYYHWLLLSVDHVVPREEGRRLGIPALYYDDFINQVLCCSGCNGFDNRYRIRREPQLDWSLEDFIQLRDETFVTRSQRIAQRRDAEKAYFLSMRGVVLMNFDNQNR